ncbi:hypothetical protein FEM48_Zijuj05G0165600 [Ziziphus jujuba var. spinosa]|uniref:RNA polymerase Rpb4/RPC9 core domain-containing protein n=1 Tax=Ziziphus jujuba var. spinosa TaxID=714518 RepID=A0A978VFX1_ZIZJJ|nr:hypothetical protein FEM48_Zijuj05G0165600 [Ziziphus jujuba var. spinosa]
MLKKRKKTLQCSNLATILSYLISDSHILESDFLFRVFEKALQYVKRFSRFTNQDAVKQVREVLSRYQLAEYELAVLGNLCPETVEEANAVVPSLKTKGRSHDDEAIEKLLNDLLMVKKFE